MSAYSFDHEALGMRLRWLRQAVDDNQSGFADRVHSSQQTVSRWEGGTMLPPLNTLIGIGQRLGIKLAAFVVYLIEGATNDLPELLREELRRSHPELQLDIPGMCRHNGERMR